MDETVQRLGSLIRQTRKMQGLTQRQLSGVGGAGERFIRELERGKASCHLGKALLVIRALGLTVQVDDEIL
ncbi:transcriptional regulator, XRE family protein [Bartonella australis AUST/NH1]|uniref:Transcriptional regulator, XRE family protein n=1 Tax=Bartonella australis (strain Aust/NH1) TaxID=1094489 RepID=M1P2U6_BARAA|nr:helix-turn-helix domain-containing protein [Bartonella australis]AGF74145.1 transcriptional regulator, XRE family protein [Bartonella australis AUST/NH1]